LILLRRPTAASRLKSLRASPAAGAFSHNQDPSATLAAQDFRSAKALFVPVLVRFDACFRSALKSHF